MSDDIFSKNREREKPTFANINLLGKCNVNCYFCLGKDIEQELAGQNQLDTHYLRWANFGEFLDRCRGSDVNKLYITGQNTDSLMYGRLHGLVRYLQHHNFKVGLRTNGYRALDCMSVINLCELSTGYSIHTLRPETNKLMLGTWNIPKWEEILNATERPRAQIVVTRHNWFEALDVLKFLSQFKHLRYVQMRRVSTDRRQSELLPDVEAYEQLYAEVREHFMYKETLWGDADVFEIFGMPVCFWRTVKTSISSLNYFTDGTISDEYFIVEGYLKNCARLRTANFVPENK